MIATWDGLELDLAPESFPAFTFRSEGLDDIALVAGDKATTLELPATTRNRMILGGPVMAERSSDTGAFTVAQGTAALFTGTGQVIERSEAGYRIAVVGGNANWMTALKDKRLRDVPMGASVPISRAMIEQTWTDETTSLYWPVVDYGNLENRPGGDNVSLLYLRPGIRVKPFMEMAFSEAGFGLIAEGAFARLWPKLVMPNTNDSIPISEAYLYQSSAEFRKATGQTITLSPVSYQEVTFPTVFSDPGGTYTGTGRYTAPYDLTTTITATLALRATLFGLDAIQVRIQLWDFTAGAAIGPEVTRNLTVWSPTLTETIVMGGLSIVAGRQIGMRVRGTYFGSNPITQLSIDNGSIIFSTQSVPLQTGIEIDIAGQSPDERVLDVLKWIGRLYCLSFDTRGPSVVMRFHDDYHLPPSAGYFDLDGRIDMAPVKLTEPAPSSFIFKHKVEEKDRLAAEARERGGRFKAGDARIATGGYDDEKEIEVGFAATFMAYVLDSLRVPALRNIDGVPNIGGLYPDRYGWAPRLLIADGITDADWNWGGVNYQYAPQCYSFNESLSAPSGTLFGDMVEDVRLDTRAVAGTVSLHWGERIRRFIAPRLQVPVLWHDHELSGFDRRTAVKCSDGYNDSFYHVEEIEQHRFGTGRLARTTLIPL